MEAEFRVAFHLVSPEEVPLQEFRRLLPPGVLNELRIRPKQAWVKGQPIRGKLLHANSGVTLFELKETGSDLTEVVDRALDVLGRAHELIEDFRKRDFEAEVACTVYVADDVPSLHLNKSALDRIHRLGAEFDLDVIRVAPREALSGR